MKIVRIDSNMVVELMPIASITEAERLYHPAILVQCTEATDEVAVGWQYIDGQWKEPTPPEPVAPPPSLEDRFTSLEAENKLLKAQNQALAERGEFIEDVIAEMAMDFYA